MFQESDYGKIKKICEKNGEKGGVKKTAKKAVKKAVSKKPSKKTVTAIPKGSHSLTPYLIVSEGSNAIEFYKKVFGAKEMMCMMKEGGKVGHAELMIGDSKIMLADEHPEICAYSPRSTQGTPVSIHLYIKDVDAVIQRAVAAGAKVVRPVENMFYGDRSGGLEDPFGHKWFVSTHIEDVTPTKIKKRMDAMAQK